MMIIVLEYVYFQIQKHDFLRFFKWRIKKVVKSQQKFSHQSLKMSLYTSFSDQCNSIPSSRNVIYSEPLLNVNAYRNFGVWSKRRQVKTATNPKITRNRDRVRDNIDHSASRCYWDGDETAVNVQVIDVLRYIYIYILSALSPYNLYQFILRFTELFPICNYSRIIASGGIFIFYYIANTCHLFVQWDRVSARSHWWLRGSLLLRRWCQRASLSLLTNNCTSNSALIDFI